MKAGVAAATVAAQDSSSGQEEMFRQKKSQSGLPLATKGGRKGQKPASIRKGKMKQTLPSIASLRFVFKLLQII